MTPLIGDRVRFKMPNSGRWTTGTVLGFHGGGVWAIARDNSFSTFLVPEADIEKVTA